MCDLTDAKLSARLLIGRVIHYRVNSLLYAVHAYCFRLYAIFKSQTSVLYLLGVTFESALEQLREKLALDFLIQRKISVNETTYLLGYSDAAAFSHAFKRWTGVSPREYRAISLRQ